MIQFNPPEIANRIGRIVCATILAGLFLAIIDIPGDIWYDSAPTLSDPIGVYFHVIANSLMWILIGSIAIPAIYVGLWAFSSRFRTIRVWQAATGIAVLLALWHAVWYDGSTGTEMATSFVYSVGIVAAILGAIAVVELVAALDSDFGPSGLTVAGAAFGAIVLCVLLVTGLSMAGVVVADQAGYAVTDEQRYEQQLEEQREQTEGEPYPDRDLYPNADVHLGDEGSADHLFGDSSDGLDYGVPWAYNVSETYTGAEYFDLREYIVDVDGEEIAVEGEYQLELQTADGEGVHSQAILNAGTAWESPADETDEVGVMADSSVPEYGNGRLTMVHVDSMWIYYDIVTEDGEVERYVAYLERDDG